MSSSNFQIAFWIVIYCLIVVQGISDVIRMNLSDWEDFVALRRDCGAVVSFELQFIANHRCTNNVNQGPFLWFCRARNPNRKMSTLRGSIPLQNEINSARSHDEKLQ